MCDARSSLRDSVESVTSDLREGNFGEAQDAVPEVRESYDELVSALGDLSEEQRSALQPEVDALRSAVEALPQADSLEDLGSGIETVVSDVQGSTTRSPSRWIAPEGVHACVLACLHEPDHDPSRR